MNELILTSGEVNFVFFFIFFSLKSPTKEAHPNRPLNIYDHPTNLNAIYMQFPYLVSLALV